MLHNFCPKYRIDRNGEGRTVQVHHHLTPEIIERILGKPDAVTMKEELHVAMDQQQDVRERVRALDHLEMLVENSDNAENLTHLQMYPILLDLASSEHPDQVRREALWILDMAMKKHPKVHLELVKYEPLRKILPILQFGSTTNNNSSVQTRSITINTIISILNNNMDGICRMDYHGGWNIARDILQDTDVIIRRKTAFLIRSLLEPKCLSPEELASSYRQIHHHYSGILMPHKPLSTHPNTLSAVNHKISIHTRDAMQEHGITHALVESLLKAPPDIYTVDEDYTAEAVRTLIAYIAVGGKFSDAEKEKLQPLIENPIMRCTWELDQSKWELLVNCVNDNSQGT